ncbi:MAG: hydroxymethylglutaryl-CoA synthase family protein [Candidatus Thiodiazotropha sp.]
MEVGIEKMNAYCGSCYVDVAELAMHRDLDMDRFDNLLMQEKSVVMPFEDPVTLAVNASKPLIDSLSRQERDRVEMVIVCSESPIDLSKSMSTYVHDYLKLNRNCRLAEVKNACYSGTFGLQSAVNFILAGVSPGAKALVIATDISRFVPEKQADSSMSDWSFVEPSSGAGAVAFLVGDKPDILSIDIGANGYYGFEVMDTCRPVPDSESGNSDVSLLAYLECCENSFHEYRKRVPGTDYRDSFDYLSFHTPFGGMVKGAHRNMMRNIIKANPKSIESDFQTRVSPGLLFCQRVGNIMGATSALSLASTLANADFSEPRRIGIFSYGSGCCAEFFSGVATADSQVLIREMGIEASLNARTKISMPEYDELINSNHELKFGTRNHSVDTSWLRYLDLSDGRGRLILESIEDYHRLYRWIGL